MGQANRYQIAVRTSREISRDGATLKAEGGSKSDPAGWVKNEPEVGQNLPQAGSKSDPYLLNNNLKDDLRESAADAGASPSNSDLVVEKGRKGTAGGKLPDGWTPNQESVQLAEKHGLTPERITLEAELFRSFFKAQGRSLSDWDARFNKWLLDEVKRKADLPDPHAHSVSRAAGRLAKMAERGELKFTPRPSLVPPDCQPTYLAPVRSEPEKPPLTEEEKKEEQRRKEASAAEWFNRSKGQPRVTKRVECAPKKFG
jgi:DnaT DNA-binding domain